MTIGGVSVDASPVARKGCVLIRFLSPLVVRRHQQGIPDRYFVYDDDESAACLSRMVSEQLGREVSLALDPIDAKKR